MYRNEFSVHYQPIYELSTRSCIGAEALLRWNKKNGEVVSPVEFISMAESQGLIIELTRHLFDLIIQDVKGWDVGGSFHLAVNISATHITSISFNSDIIRLKDSLDNAFNIVLEVTEQICITDFNIVSDKLIKLRDKGVYVAIDDFGTGYSSLKVIQFLPVDYLKIDKCFIDMISSENTGSPILEMIVELANKTGIKLIAEAVCAKYQECWLRKNNVLYAQGYFYSKALPSEDFYYLYLNR